MPWSSLGKVPARIKNAYGDGLTLSIANSIAKMAEGIKAKGDGAKDPWAVAIAHYKRKKKGGMSKKIREALGEDASLMDMIIAEGLQESYEGAMPVSGVSDDNFISMIKLSMDSSPGMMQILMTAPNDKDKQKFIDRYGWKFSELFTDALRSVVSREGSAARESKKGHKVTIQVDAATK